MVLGATNLQTFILKKDYKTVKKQKLYGKDRTNIFPISIIYEKSLHISARLRNILNERNISRSSPTKYFKQGTNSLIEQILIFGKSQITTQAIRACIWQNIPIVYLSAWVIVMVAFYL